LLARIGLIGGPDPAQRLAMANGRFAEGDLTGAANAIDDAQRIIDSAEISGLIRLVIAVLVIVLLAAVAFLLMRRRSSYTSGP
jgi:hypothetical protein